jgi:hypothetical protein
MRALSLNPAHKICTALAAYACSTCIPVYIRIANREVWHSLVRPAGAGGGALVARVTSDTHSANISIPSGNAYLVRSVERASFEFGVQCSAVFPLLALAH